MHLSHLSISSSINPSHPSISSIYKCNLRRDLGEGAMLEACIYSNTWSNTLKSSWRTIASRRIENDFPSGLQTTTSDWGSDSFTASVSSMSWKIDSRALMGSSVVTPWVTLWEARRSNSYEGRVCKEGSIMMMMMMMMMMIVSWEWLEWLWWLYHENDYDDYDDCIMRMMTILPWEWWWLYHSCDEHHLYFAWQQ